MRTKIVYVLVSDSKDYYYEQVLISMFSLKKRNPDAYIVVIVDNLTNDSFCGTREQIKTLASQIIVIDLPLDYTKKIRSRYLKTSTRNIIDGDYLFIDTDTIICDSLDIIDNVSCEIGCVLDMHGLSYSGYAQQWDKDRIDEMNWGECIRAPRYNSGVMLVKDTNKTREFFRLWHKNWIECKEKGIYIDQLALRKTYCEYPIIEAIEDEWNCMIKNQGFPYVNKAKIIHYFYEEKTNNYLISNDGLLNSVKKQGCIDCTLEYLIDNPKAFLINADQMNFIEKSEVLQRAYYKAPFLFKSLQWITNHYFGIMSRI